MSFGRPLESSTYLSSVFICLHSASGRKSLQQGLRLCYPLNSTEDADQVKGWLSSIYVNLAMVDYPYPANFLAPLPGWPIKVSTDCVLKHHVWNLCKHGENHYDLAYQVVCKFLKAKEMTDQQLIDALGQLLNVYMNYTGSAMCFKTDSDATSHLGDRGWGYQVRKSGASRAQKMY